MMAQVLCALLGAIVGGVTTLLVMQDDEKKAAETAYRKGRIDAARKANAQRVQDYIEYRRTLADKDGTIQYLRDRAYSAKTTHDLAEVRK